MLNGIIFKMLAGFLATTSAGLGSPAPTAVAGDSQVKISWALPSTQQILGVEVDESLDDTTWVIATHKLPPTSTHVNIQGLTNGKNYWFRVRWVWLDGTLGIPSPTLVEIPINNPSVPTGLVATPSTDQVGLSWDKDPNKSIVGYEIDQSTDGGTSWSVIKGNTGSPSNGYLVNNLLAGTTYTFRIRALGFAGIKSEYSESAVAKVAVAPTGGYALNYSIKNSKVTLTWDTPVDLSDVQTYDINVSGDGGVNWYKVATVQGGINTATVPYVIGGSTYQIIATSSGGQTSDSQIQLVENNVIPDSIYSGAPSVTPNSVTTASTEPSLSASPSPTSPNNSTQSSRNLLIAIAIALVAVGGGIWAFANSRKNNNSKSRYKTKKRKPIKPNKKKAKKKK